MKYLSVVIVFWFLCWTWGLVHTPPVVGSDVQSLMVEAATLSIESAVKNQIPHAKELEVDQVWTEIVDENQVRTTFTYSYKIYDEDSGATKHSNKGHALFVRRDHSEERWSLDSVKLIGSSIVFPEEAVIVSPGADE